MLADVWLNSELHPFSGVSWPALCPGNLCHETRPRRRYAGSGVNSCATDVYLATGQLTIKKKFMVRGWATDKHLSLRVPRAPLHVENRSSPTFPISPVFSPSCCFLSFCVRFDCREGVENQSGGRNVGRDSRWSFNALLKIISYWIENCYLFIKNQNSFN